MSLIDSVSDLLTRIRNAQMIGKKFVESPMSLERRGVLQVLFDEGYIAGFSVVEGKNSSFKILRVELKYNENGPVIAEIKRISKPGRRVYSSIKNLPLIKNGLGISILSTNKGILSDVEARKMLVGGEVICSVF